MTNLMNSLKAGRGSGSKVSAMLGSFPLFYPGYGLARVVSMRGLRVMVGGARGRAFVV